MAGSGVCLSIDDREVKALFQRLRTAADDLTPVMDRIGAAVVEDVLRRFQEGAGPGGDPWPPSLRAKLERAPTLVDTARLRDSITYEPGPRSVRVGTNVIYAAIHQFGGTIAAKNPSGRLAFHLADGSLVRPREVTIPARPFLGIDDVQEDIIATEIEAWLGKVSGSESTKD